jgi:hypothetical protein
MAKINVPNLHPVGSDLFFDSENYISELSDNELGTINNGFVSIGSILCTVAPPVTVTERDTETVSETLFNQ